jgi:ABC-type multidrug transport system ATPase subunit
MHDTASNTYDLIKNGFNTPLDEHFCSLGLGTEYYYNITKVIDKETGRKLLKYLRDCTQDGRIYENFCNNPTFQHSLIRDLASKEAYREGNYIINDDSPNTAFCFTFDYQAIYDINKSCKWDISFSQSKPSYLRTIGVIGENGVGKTMLLTSLVKAILQKETPKSLSKEPRFQTCVAICSSERDGLLNIKSDNKIHYQACNLRVHDTFKEMQSCIEDHIIKRPTLHRILIRDRYHQTLKKHLPSELITDLIKEISDDNGTSKVFLNHDCLNHLIEVLSSGQLQIFELITYLYAHIHLSSLIIFDEPEVHMHPSLIMDFMPLLNELLEEFNSFAIITTHSPLVIRELVQDNVYRMTVDEERNPYIDRVTYRTFGEDISVLYHNIFGYNESQSYFRKIIRKTIQNLKDYRFDYKTREDYIHAVTKELSKDVALGLSGRSAIRDVVFDMIQETGNYEETC